MNIFATFTSPVDSALYLQDDFKRLNKIILESAQLICTAGHVTNQRGEIPYKKTHENHPCSIWTCESRKNAEWLLSHFLTLCSLFEEQRGKKHKCELLFEILKNIVNKLPNGKQTPFVNCTDFKDIEDVHEAYRLHLAKKWEQDRLKAKLKTTIKWKK